MPIRVIISISIIFWSISSSGWAQRLEEQKKTAYQLASPFQAVYNHYHNLRQDSYNPALSSYSLAYVGNLSYEQRIERSIQLNQVLKGNGLYYREEEVPRDPNYQDTTVLAYVYRPFPDFPDIYLERINFKGQFVWVYSAETVAAIPDLYRQTFPLLPQQMLDFLQDDTSPELVFGLDYVHLIGLLVLLFGPFLFFKIFNRVFAFILRRVVGKLDSQEKSNHRIRLLARPISLFITFLFLRFSIPFFQFPALWSYYILFGIDIAIPVFALLMTLGTVDLVFIYVDKKINKQRYIWYVQVFPFLKTLLKIIAIGVNLIFLLENLDLNVTALLAGLSIGGLAFALAAQDTIKNFFGSIMIFADQPFRVGDWITGEEIDGVVEEIGVRSTRIRTFYNSVLHVPNGRMADMTVDNLGMRVYRRYRSTLDVTYDTPPAQLKVFMEGIREIIQKHPHTRKDFFAVNFIDYKSASLGILMNVFFIAADFSQEWERREQLNLAILELAHALGIRFAFPTQTLHIEAMPGQESLSPDYTNLNEIALREKMRQHLGLKPQQE